MTEVKQWTALFCRLPVLLVISAITAILSGCGGGGGGSSTSTVGSYQAMIAWPPLPVAGAVRPRIIPLAAQSIRVVLENSSAVSAATQLAVRPSVSNSSVLTFSNLPAGAYTVRSTAYPNADGTGTPVATGSSTVTLQGGTVASGALTLNSTVNQLALSPASPAVAVGSTLLLTASAQDATGATVMLAPSKLKWVSSSTMATVDITGLVTGVAAGSAAISVTDSDSGKTASVIVTVSNAAEYTVTDLGAGINSEADGLNAQAMVTGWVYSPGIPHAGYTGSAFLDSGGQLTNLGYVLPAGSLGNWSSHGYAINGSGTIAGTAVLINGGLDITYPEYPFVLSNGAATQIGTAQGAAYAINNSGQVTGTSSSSPFLYSQGTLTLLDTRQGDGYGINASGQVTGDLAFSSGTSHAFLYGNGQIQDLGTLSGYTGSVGRAINSSGQITGDAYRAGTGSDGMLLSHAFSYANGALTDLGVLPGTTTSVGEAINTAGQIVGSSGEHAFVYTGGKMIDLNTVLPVGSGWLLANATGINDKGQICGVGVSGSDPTAPPRAFLLTPITPGSMAQPQAK